MPRGEPREDWPETLVNALRRPATYVGAAREITSVLQCVARYPSGLMPEPAGAPLAHPPGGQPTERVELGGTGPGADHGTPVMLVHGYGHNHSGWWNMRRHLQEAGFGRLESFDYRPFERDVPASARQLAARVEQLRRRTGAERVHVVAHSLGGILLRWMVQELDSAEVVDTAVTLGTPHEGTRLAWIAPGGTAAQLRPGSWVLRRLAESARPSPVRWVAVYSNLDELVRPSRSAMISHPALDAVNLLAKDHGHMSLMVSPRVARAVAGQLEVAEGVAGVASVSNLPVAAGRRAADDAAAAGGRAADDGAAAVPAGAGTDQTSGAAAAAAVEP